MVVDWMVCKLNLNKAGCQGRGVGPEAKITAVTLAVLL
jgi:hypothetical protein